MTHQGADPLTEIAIRRGHRELLDTLRELVADAVTAAEGPTAGARVVLAFLRQSVMTFAAWEERSRGGADPVAEDTAFEHAFLAVEIEALARAIHALDMLDATPASVAARERVAAEERIVRQMHRIEAVLEIHTEKVEDREVVSPA